MIRFYYHDPLVLMLIGGVTVPMSMVASFKCFYVVQQKTCLLYTSDAADE